MSENSNKDDDSLGSFYMGRMRNPPEPRRILPKGMLTVVTVLAFGAIIWYAYPQGQEKFASLNVPTITADKTPYKFKPEDPGGMEVPHQDSTVFDPMDRKSANASAVEKLGAPPEEPVDKESVLSTSPAIPKKMEKLNLDMQIKEVTAGTEKLVKTDASRVEPAAGEDETASEVNDGEEAMTAKSEDEKVTDEKTMPPGVEAVKQEPLKVEEVKPEPVKTEEPVKAEEGKPVPVKTEPAKKPDPVKEKPKAAEAKPAATTAAKPAPKKDGIYIQLGSYRDLNAAKADWAKLQKKFPQSIGKMTMHTERADLGAKGVFHRLQAKAASEERAKHICTVLKSSGNPDCMVVR